MFYLVLNQSQEAAVGIPAACLVSFYPARTVVVASAMNGEAARNY
jgi:hypothetical protein